MDLTFCGVRATCSFMFGSLNLNRTFLITHMNILQTWEFQFDNTSLHEFNIENSKDFPIGSVLAWQTMDTGEIAHLYSPNNTLGDRVMLPDNENVPYIGQNRTFDVRIIGERYFKTFNRTNQKFYAYPRNYHIEVFYDRLSAGNVKTVNAIDSKIFLI